MFDDVSIAQYAATKAKAKFRWVGNQRDDDAESGAAMNLKFWKKKTAPEEDAASQQAESDGDEALQDSSDDEAVGDSGKPGFMTRLKSRFTALFSRSRKSDVAKDDAEDSGDEPDGEPDKEQNSGTDSKPAAVAKEATGKTSLLARIKLKIAGLLTRFKKSPQKAADAKEHGQPAKDAGGKNAGEAQEKPKKAGLIEKLKPLLSSLGGKLLAAGSRGLSLLSEYMIYLLSVLAMIMLVSLIYMARDIIFPPLVRKTTSSDPAKYMKEVPASAPEEAPVLEPESAPNATPLTAAEMLQKKSEEAKAKAEALIKEAEELQKKSEEAKAQAEALKKKQEEERALAEALRKKQEEERARRYGSQSGSQPGRQTAGGTGVMPGSNEWTAGNKDPKATAQTLKEAIEAMNNESSGKINRPGKPPGNPP